MSAVDDGAVSVRVQEVWKGADQPPTQLLRTTDPRLVVGSRWVFGPTRTDDGYRLGPCPGFLPYADAAAQRPDEVRAPRVAGGGQPGFVVLAVVAAGVLLLLRIRRSFGGR